MIYLDHNATAPLRPEALAAMVEWLGRPANPSAAHALGQAAAMAVDHARGQVAQLLGVPASRVVFTGGASESNATVLSAGRWAVSAVEHPSVLRWASAVLPVDGRGVVSIDALDALQEGAVHGVSVMLANNETGVVQPVGAVIAWARRRGLRVHVDAAQAPGRLDLAGLAAADFVTISAHKLGGPTGVGALVVPEGTAPAPLLRGASQERGWRAGTHNVAGIAGFGAAAAALASRLPCPSTLRDRLEAGLVALGGQVAGAGAARLPQTTSVAFSAWLAPELVMALDLEGVAVSAGSACSSGAARPSAVLAAMGFSGSAVRFSLGEGTTEAEVHDALLAVERVLARPAAP